MDRTSETRLQGLIDELAYRHAAIDQDDRPDMEASELKLCIRHLNNAAMHLYNANEIQEHLDNPPARRGSRPRQGE